MSPEILLNVLLILVLIGVNGWLAMAELALVSVRPTALEAAPGKSAARALELARDPNRSLAAIQIGITLVAILSGAIGEATLGQELTGWLARVGMAPLAAEVVGTVLVVGGVTYLSLVFGELVPKRIALARTTKVALHVGRPMYGISRWTAPAVRLLAASTNLVARVLRLPTEPEPVTEEEVQAVLDEAVEAGQVRQAEHDLVERVFQLDDSPIDTMMTPMDAVVAVDVTAGPEDVLARIQEGRHSHYPVRDEQGRIACVVHTRDLLVRCLEGRPLDLRELQVEVPQLTSGSNLLEAVEEFRSSGAPLGLVVDRDGAPVGLLSLHDVLEALVGRVRPAQPGLVREPDGALLADTNLPLAALEELGLHGDGTLADFLPAGLAEHPGATVRHRGLRIEAVALEGGRVRSVRLRPEGAS